jgi:ubiquinone/menaquinone biosynthesis C-methylase UbiE
VTALAHGCAVSALFKRLKLVGDAFELPFEDRAFERVFSGHFYGDLEHNDGTRFLAEARRVAPELVIAAVASP